MSVFFSSDFHLGHANIIKYCNRPFPSVEEMDDAIINNLNDAVRPDDTLYFLGDFCMGVRDRDRYLRRSAEYRRRIQCRNVILVWGNHDRRHDAFRGLFTSAHDLLEIVVEGQMIVLCHYAMRVWNKSHRGSWHLYGHDHGNLPDDPYSLSFDVGVDCWDFRPLRFEQVRSVLVGKKGWPCRPPGERVQVEE